MFKEVDSKSKLNIGNKNNDTNLPSFGNLDKYSGSQKQQKVSLKSFDSHHKALNAISKRSTFPIINNNRIDIDFNDANNDLVGNIDSSQ